MKRYTATVEVPDDYEPRFAGKNQNVDFYFLKDNGTENECVSTEMIEDGWMPLSKEARDG